MRVLVIDDEKDVIELLHQYAANGTPYVLATVVRTEAPTSAHPGDKAVVTADGRLHGWIGGSCSEPIVRREALRALAEGVPQLVRIVPAPEVKQTRKRGELMVATTCPSGGALDIFIEPHLPRPLLLVFGDSPDNFCHQAAAPTRSPPLPVPNPAAASTAPRFSITRST